MNVASRIAGLSAAEEVLVSETGRQQALKGVDEPVRVWAVTSSAGQASA